MKPIKALIVMSILSATAALGAEPGEAAANAASILFYGCVPGKHVVELSRHAVKDASSCSATSEPAGAQVTCEGTSFFSRIPASQWNAYFRLRK